MRARRLRRPGVGKPECGKQWFGKDGGGKGRGTTLRRAARDCINAGLYWLRSVVPPAERLFIGLESPHPTSRPTIRNHDIPLQASQAVLIFIRLPLFSGDSRYTCALRPREGSPMKSNKSSKLTYLTLVRRTLCSTLASASERIIFAFPTDGSRGSVPAGGLISDAAGNL